jgi:hypothetical protein
MGWLQRHTKSCLLAVAAAGLLAGCTGQRAAQPPRPTAPASPTSTTSSNPPPSTTTTTSTIAESVTPPRVDGSLGSQAVRKACTLLTRAEIAAEFGGPVGPSTPAYPYCEWLVGKDAFLALDYEPGVSYATLTQWTGMLEKVRGVGDDAMIGDNRYLYFTSGRNSFWLLWQQVGDFTGIHEPQLAALARDVLSHPIPAGPLAQPPPVPPGPPIYFAGDSTAAGPEWAWVTYHTGSPALRTLAEYQVGSGLVVPAYFDWPLHLLAIMAEERPKLVIYMGSANDGQDLPYGSGSAAVGTPAWRQVYGERVGATMSDLTRKGAKVLWIGEPAMQSPSLSAYMLDVDEVCAAEAARHPGVSFFNPGTVLNLPGWRYTPTVDIDGREVDVRLDGIHLNEAGSLFLADKIAPIVDRILGVR